MQTSGQGIRFIQSFEKCELIQYQDSAGHLSIGYGHLILNGENYPKGITQDQADSLFLSDLVMKAENPVKCSVAVDIKQNQFDALVSLCFNIGAGNFAKSTLLKLLNAYRFEEAADEFLKWDHIDGQVSNGLYIRRVAESNIFENAVYNNHI